MNTLFNTKDNPILITDPKEIDSVLLHNWMKWFCVECGKEVVISKRNDKGRIERYKTLLCQPCYAKKVKLEKYGDPNYNNRESAAETWDNKSDEEKQLINNRRITTNMMTRGVPHQMYDPKVVAKLLNTVKNKSQEEKDATLAKFRQTWKNKSQQEKNATTDKNLSSRINNYNMVGNTSTINGKPDYSNRIEAIKTHEEKTGYKTPLNDPEEVNRRIEKYGSLTPNHLWFYYGIYFHSMWELYVWIYCIEKNIPIIREPTSFEFKDKCGVIRHYIPDFMINGKLIEIKGKQFIKPDGTVYCPFRYPDETDEEYEFICDLYERKHQCAIANGVEYWLEQDIHFMIMYVRRKYGYDYVRQFRRDNPLNPSYWCSNILNPGYYQRQDFVPLVQSATPYAKPDPDGYVFSDTEMVTPFDIK